MASLEKGYMFDGLKAADIANDINSSLKAIKEQTLEFQTCMKSLFSPDTWGGDAAKENYGYFVDALNYLIGFANAFGTNFKEFANSFASLAEEADKASGGSGKNAAAFGSVTYEEIPKVDKSLDVVTDRDVNIPDKIRAAQNQANGIADNVKKIRTSLIEYIDKLDNGSTVWDGPTARGFRTNVENAITNELDKAIQILDDKIQDFAIVATNGEIVG